MNFWLKPGPNEIPNQNLSRERFPSSGTSRFWKLFRELPAEVQDLAFEKYELFKQDPVILPLGFRQKERFGRSILDDLTELLPSEPESTSHGFGLEAMKTTITC
jgi:hypothetical protein